MKAEASLPWVNVPQYNSPSPRQTRRVALLGISQRQIRIDYAQKMRKRRQLKPLPASVKTLGDLIQVKRHEKNLTSCHVALKMGIATALVHSWEDNTTQPDNRQLEVLATLLGFDAGIWHIRVNKPRLVCGNHGCYE